MRDGMLSGSWRRRGGQTYRPGVAREYHAAAARDVLPTLGRRRLDQVSQPDLMRLAHHLEAGGHAPSTVRNAIEPLRVIYRRAVLLGIVTSNPTHGLELPTGSTTRERAASPAEAAELVAALSTSYLRSLWAVALYGGLRGGELRALQWGDVTGRGVHVQRSLALGVPKARAQAETLPPKTHAGRRHVPLPDRAMRALATHQVEHVIAGADASPGGYLWPGRGGGPFSNTAIRNASRRHWEAAGLEPMRLHEARHSAISMWIASGWPLKLVSQQAGHASITITLDRYGHLFPADIAAAAAAFSNYLDAASG